MPRLTEGRAQLGGFLHEDRYWPNQPRGGRAEVGSTGRLRGGAAISGEMPGAVQEKQTGSWIGVWSPHPVVSNLLCVAFMRAYRLRELVDRAELVSLDCRPHTQNPFLLILDTVPLTLEGTVAAVRRAMASFPHSKLVGLVDPIGGDVIQLLRLGLSGLVQASTKLEADLASAITTIRRGSIWVPESVLLEHAARVQSLMRCQLTRHTALSAREAQVLDSVIWGRPNKEIASILAIAERTVKFHVSNILSKLGMERRTELVRWHELI